MDFLKRDYSEYRRKVCIVIGNCRMHPIQQSAFRYLKGGYDDELPRADYLIKNAFHVWRRHHYLKREDLDFIVHNFKMVLNEIAL